MTGHLSKTDSKPSWQCLLSKLLFASVIIVYNSFGLYGLGVACDLRACTTRAARSGFLLRRQGVTPSHWGSGFGAFQFEVLSSRFGSLAFRASDIEVAGIPA